MWVIIIVVVLIAGYIAVLNTDQQEAVQDGVQSVGDFGKNVMGIFSEKNESLGGLDCLSNEQCIVQYGNESVCIDGACWR